MFSKFLTNISLFFLKDIVMQFKGTFKNFDRVLEYTGINEDSISYISNISFISIFFLIVIEFAFIYLMIRLGILFNLFSFFITIFISFTFAFMIFLLLFKYPFFILNKIKKKIGSEFQRSIKHLSVLRDENLTIKDVLNVFENLENNELLSREAKKIIALNKRNHNLKDTFKSIISETYSEVEKNFFRKLIEVIDKKEDLNQVILDFLTSLEQSKRELSEQKKSRINILFLMSIFLFFFFIVILIIFFITFTDYFLLKESLLIFSIIFAVIEFILIGILYK
ncbi:MAG: type II secretion system F family protein [Candidatus ainarchaeum sp.]|nr:type II secretion system F family protein [Candidatus ainarchaeum sp.]